MLLVSASPSKKTHEIFFSLLCAIHGHRHRTQPIMNNTSVTTPTTVTFASRVKDATRGDFEPWMRRPFLILALFEAKRCLAPHFPKMRQFQKKVAVMFTAIDIIGSLDFLSGEQKASIVSLTVPKDTKPCIAKIALAKRETQIKDEILPGIKGLSGDGKTHQDLCDEFMQKRYEEAGGKGVYPLRWEFKTFPVFLIYRVYYRKLEIDGEIFAPIAPREVGIPEKKPDGPLWEYVFANCSPVMIAGNAKASNPEGVKAYKNQTLDKGNLNRAGGIKPSFEANHNKRMEHLMEIKVRLELLKEIEEILPQKRMMTEMKHLFWALPPPLAAHQVKNRRAAFLEAQLRMELLKKTKTAIPPKKIAREVMKVFVELPPFPGNSGGKAKGMKANGAGMHKDAEVAGKGGWENVVKHMDAAVDGMEIV